MKMLASRKAGEEKLHTLMQKMDGKGDFASYMKKSIMKFKDRIEQNYGAKIPDEIIVFEYSPLKIWKRRDSLDSVFGSLSQIYALKRTTTCVYAHSAIAISRFRWNLMRLKYPDEKEFWSRVDSTLAHELTHFTISPENPGNAYFQGMVNSILREGLSEFSKKRFAPEPELKRPKKLLDRMKRAVNDFAMGLIFFDDRRKERFLRSLSKEESDAMIAKNPKRWVTFRGRLEMGLRFISALADHFKDDKKLFRQVVFGRKPTIEEILEPSLYIEEIEKESG